MEAERADCNDPALIEVRRRTELCRSRRRHATAPRRAHRCSAAVRTLLECGADPTQVNKNGSTPMTRILDFATAVRV
jgi:hypothetical protein